MLKKCQMLMILCHNFYNYSSIEQVYNDCLLLCQKLSEMLKASRNADEFSKDMNNVADWSSNVPPSKV